MSLQAEQGAGPAGPARDPHSSTSSWRAFVGMPGRSRPTARIAVFLLLTFGLSAIFYALLVRRGGLEGAGAGLEVLGLMWCPGIAALLTQLVFRRTLAGLGWGWGKTRYQVSSFLLPLAYAGCVYVPVWWLGLGGLDAEVLHRAAVRFGLDAVPEPWVLVPLVPVVGIVGLVPNAIFALGEEIGWRGFLVPELRRATTFTRTALLSGLVWAAWHMPLILFAGYRAETPVWFGVVCFTVLVVGVSVPLAWLRLKSGSLWTAMFLHAGHNLYIQSFFDRLTTDAGPTEWIVGEFGAGLALVAAGVGFLFWRRRGALSGSNEG
ncbi:MAG: type II CAAX endopeptidase family protein [Acidobacteriota bacterium]|jgi:membrane protease YdiL (CAAX protease family)